MRVLTVMSVVFMPLTFIVGLYGMNFDAPAFHWRHGYLMVWLILIGLWRSFARASGEPASTASWRSFVRHTGWLNAESQAACGEVLEIAILALMAVEIVLSFFH